MKLGKAVDICLGDKGNSENPLRNNSLFNRLMNNSTIQCILFKHEINFRKKQDKPEMSGEYLSMKDKDTSIVLADTQVLEKCIAILKKAEEQENLKGAKEDVISLLETEIQDIDELERELASEIRPSEIQVNEIIVGTHET